MIFIYKNIQKKCEKKQLRNNKGTGRKIAMFNKSNYTGINKFYIYLISFLNLYLTIVLINT